MRTESKKYVTDCKEHKEFYNKYNIDGSDRLLIMDKIYYELYGEDFITAGFSTTGDIVWFKGDAA